MAVHIIHYDNIHTGPYIIQVLQNILEEESWAWVGMCRVDTSSHHKLLISTEPRHVHTQQNSTIEIIIHLDMHTQQNLITKYDIYMHSS